jgi:hypothetical protein
MCILVAYVVKLSAVSYQLSANSRQLSILSHQSKDQAGVTGSFGSADG